MMCFSSVELRKAEIRATAEYRKRISEEFDRNTAEARERHRLKQEAQEMEEELRGDALPKRRGVNRKKGVSLEDADLVEAITFTLGRLQSSATTPSSNAHPLCAQAGSTLPPRRSRPSKSYACMSTRGSVPKNVRDNERARLCRAKTSTEAATTTLSTSTPLQAGVVASTLSPMPPPPVPEATLADDTPPYRLRPRDKIRKTEHAEKVYRM